MSGSADATELVRSAALAFLKGPEYRLKWRPFYELAYKLPPIYLDKHQWLLAGRDDVIEAMKAPGAELTALYPATRSPLLNEAFLGMLPFERGREHRRLRSLTSTLFSATAISRLQNHISALLEDLLYPAVFEREGCDVLTTLGVRVPEAVSCLLLDVAPDDWHAVGQWSREIYRQMGRYDQSADEIRASEGAYYAFCEYVRRRMKGEGGLSYGGVGDTLIATWRNGDLDEEQLLSYFTLFLLTGLDTLTYAIGNSLWFFGSADDVFSIVRKTPELADTAFREVLRLWGPIRICVRHLQDPVPLNSTVLPQGSIVFLLVHAANRDPRRIDRPDEVLWDRKHADDLAFGVGAHGCIGTAIGKLIGRTLFRTLAVRCKSLQATPGLNDPTFIRSLPILGVESVRLFAQPA